MSEISVSPDCSALNFQISHPPYPTSPSRWGSAANSLSPPVSRIPSSSGPNAQENPVDGLDRSLTRMVSPGSTWMVLPLLSSSTSTNFSDDGFEGVSLFDLEQAATKTATAKTAAAVRRITLFMGGNFPVEGISKNSIGWIFSAWTKSRRKKNRVRPPEGNHRNSCRLDYVPRAHMHRARTEPRTTSTPLCGASGAAHSLNTVCGVS